MSPARCGAARKSLQNRRAQPHARFPGAFHRRVHFTPKTAQSVDLAKPAWQAIFDGYGIILERISVMDYRFDPDYLK